MEFVKKKGNIFTGNLGNKGNNIGLKLPQLPSLPVNLILSIRCESL